MNMTYPKLGQYLKDAAKKAGKDAPWYSCSWPDYVKFMAMLSRSVALSVSLTPKASR